MVGEEREAYALGVRAGASNTSTIYIGDKSAQVWDLEPGDILTFNAGECDLSDEWYVKGATAGDMYTVMWIDKSIVRNIGKPKRKRDLEKID